jgi:hypothetical protein
MDRLGYCEADHVSPGGEEEKLGTEDFELRGYFNCLKNKVRLREGCVFYVGDQQRSTDYSTYIQTTLVHGVMIPEM